MVNRPRREIDRQHGQPEMWTLENAARLLNLGVTKDLKQKGGSNVACQESIWALVVAMQKLEILRLPAREWRRSAATDRDEWFQWAGSQRHPLVDE